MEESSPIQDFFQGSHVLITGATGFFGKALTEKLSYSCQGIAKLYLLIRQKKDVSPKDRFEKLMDDVVFTRLKKERPDFRVKISIISGDCSLPGLGLSDEDLELIRNKINVVYHAAANVRYDMDLKTAIDTNVGGTVEVLKVCKQIKNLRAMVYISTLYSYCTEDIVEERFYPPPKCSDRILQLASLLSAEELETLAPKLLEKWPYSYVFSKAVAENIVKQEEGSMPICIIRPAIVQSAGKEPLPGWMDNIYGPMAMTLGIFTGVLKIYLFNVNAKHNIVPIDSLVNCIIAATRESYTKFWNGDTNIDIYNFGSVNVNPPQTWKKANVFIETLQPIAPLSAVWCIDGFAIGNRYLFWFLSIFVHFIPALLVDVVCLLTGRKPKFFRLVFKATKLQDFLRRFSLHSFKMTDNNVRALLAKQKSSESDQQTFPFDLEALDWEEGYSIAGKGLREFILKEPWDNLPQALARQARFRLLQRLIFTLLFLLLIWCFIF